MNALLHCFPNTVHVMGASMLEAFLLLGSLCDGNLGLYGMTHS